MPPFREQFQDVGVTFSIPEEYVSNEGFNVIHGLVDEACAIADSIAPSSPEE